MVVPARPGGGKESTIQSQTAFIRDALEDGFLVVCPDERGSGDRREFPEQGDESEKIRMNSHRELLQVCIGFGQSVIGGSLGFDADLQIIYLHFQKVMAF